MWVYPEAFSQFDVPEKPLKGGDQRLYAELPLDGRAPYFVISEGWNNGALQGKKTSETGITD